MDDFDPDFDPSMLDELRLLSRPGEDLLLRIVEIFQRDAPRHLTELRAGLAAGSALRVHRASHTLKGAAGNLGLIGLADRCEAVVEATRDHETATRCRVSATEVEAIAEAIDEAMDWLQRAVPR